MRNQVSNFLRLGKEPVSVVGTRRPKSQLSWSKRYEGLDFQVNGSGPDNNNNRPTEPGFNVEPIFTQLGSKVDIFEPMEDEDKLEVLENRPEEDVNNENMEWVAGWA
ncbi:MAG TPA: hypothetical protein V6D13_14690 [Halomicronema sp.]